jgi:hypothetical protein
VIALIVAWSIERRAFLRRQTPQAILEHDVRALELRECLFGRCGRHPLELKCFDELTLGRDHVASLDHAAGHSVAFGGHGSKTLIEGWHTELKLKAGLYTGAELNAQ